MLVTGGESGCQIVGESYDCERSLDSAERYNPFDDRWIVEEPMFVHRSDHTATALGNGSVLVAGGRRWQDDAVLAATEIYRLPPLPLREWVFLDPQAIALPGQSMGARDD